MTTRRQIVDMLRRAAEECYPPQEAQQIAEIIVEKCGGVSRNQLIVEPDKELHIEDLERMQKDLRSWRPVQYIVGRADFCDMEFFVKEGVLIPRPETEELVAWIASESKVQSSILDVCTGSGCIAISLARAVTRSHVAALDLSTDALEIARCNAKRLASKVEFFEADALGDFAANIDTRFDVIVSNPPYIPASDRRMMRPNVTEYEPDMALFVPDAEPLLFYRSIARNARKLLNDGGKLYFEIYEAYAKQMTSMLHDEGYKRVRLRNDFCDKPRMICAEID